MKHTLLLLALLPITLLAQTTFDKTAKEEIFANPKLSAHNHMAYIEPTKALTPTPKGYEAFYLSNYARHGSRWLIGKGDYDNAFNKLTKAAKYGKLTPEGQEVLRRVEKIRRTSTQRLGDLTTVGERQHHGIGKRMANNFPEIFKSPNTYIDARSTVVRRCILSMVAECLELAQANPKATFHNDTSDSLQYYLNKPHRAKPNPMRHALDSVVQSFYPQCYKPERLMEYLFNDQQFVRDSLGSRKTLMDEIYTIARNMQGHDIDNDLYYIFTKQELYDMWRYENIYWYAINAQCPQNPLACFSQDNLLNNILNTADTIVCKQGFYGATLRFGHDSCVYPLAALLELGEAGVKVDMKDFDKLEDYCRDYNIVSMASNIQIVFYRAKKGNAPILIKVLLNEREVPVGNLPTDNYPYYKWTDFEQYFRAKLAAYEAL